MIKSHANHGSKLKTTKQLIRVISDVLEGFPGILFGTVFGSANKERLTPRSDVDVAVAGGKKLSLEEKVELLSALSKALGREVDLIDLQTVSGLILEQALCQASIVKNSDPSVYAELLKRLWYNQADMMPYVRRILEQRAAQWLH